MYLVQKDMKVMKHLKLHTFSSLSYLIRKRAEQTDPKLHKIY